MHARVASFCYEEQYIPEIQLKKTAKVAGTLLVYNIGILYTDQYRKHDLPKIGNQYNNH